MKTFYLSHWQPHCAEDMIEKQAVDLLDVHEQLTKDYPDREIRLDGFNYHFITNASHYLAAGYPMNNVTISIARSPAHFNRDFFYVLGSREEIN